MTQQRTFSADRRTFLKATAAAAALPAPFIHGEDKSGSKNAVVGVGEFRYECLHDWGMDSLPSGASYGNASHGVALDADGQIHATTENGDLLCLASIAR